MQKPWPGGKIKYHKRIQVLWIAFFWFAFGYLDTAFIHYGVDENIGDNSLNNFLVHSFFHSLGYGVAGLIVGSWIVFFVRTRNRSRTFIQYLLINVGLFLVIAISLNLLGYLISSMLIEDKHVLHPVVLQSTVVLFTEPLNIKHLLFGMLLIIGTLIVLQVNDKYGPGGFANYLLGRYHHPTEEERIFMFLDLKSSTAISEQIGHIAFHNFKADFFRDITATILSRGGEIFQYVGDEVVISWKMRAGLTNSNCIHSFFEMEYAIESKRDKYLNRYGHIPAFKAGMHSGKVTVGEIGLIKKDVVYSGDVLNTASRIQSQCNQLKSNLLISDDLLKRLAESLSDLDYTPVGKFTLKGKTKAVVLYHLSRPND